MKMTIGSAVPNTPKAIISGRHCVMGARRSASPIININMPREMDLLRALPPENREKLAGLLREFLVILESPANKKAEANFCGLIWR